MRVRRGRPTEIARLELCRRQGVSKYNLLNEEFRRRIELGSIDSKRDLCASELVGVQIQTELRRL